MKIETLFSRILGFYPHTGGHIAESKKPSTNIRDIGCDSANPALGEFRGIRRHQDQGATFGTETP